MCCMDQTPARTSKKVPVNTRNRLRAHQSIQRLIIYMLPPALTDNCLAASVWPPFCAVMLTCQMPPLPRLPVPSYMPPPLSLSVTTVRMAGMPMEDMAGIKNVMLTCAPVMGCSFELVSFTLNVLPPLWGGEGIELNSILGWPFAP